VRPLAQDPDGWEATELGTVLMWVFAVVAAGCARDDDQVAQRLASLPPTPAAHRMGEQLYDRNCAGCHGPKARGSDRGPPLAHRVYEPSHHSDQAFYLAAQNGVAAHHWRFGNMPAQAQVSRADMAAIVAYVRWVQREAGVYR
jgi:mono/diheme cytochrome c family protein